MDDDTTLAAMLIIARENRYALGEPRPQVLERGVDKQQILHKQMLNNDKKLHLPHLMAYLLEGQKLILENPQLETCL